MMNRLLLFAAAILISGSMSAQIQVIFQVDMSTQTIGDTVSVAGGFQVAAGFPNDWTPGQVLMTDADMDGVYVDTVSLPAGTYEYKYTFTTGGSDTWESPPGTCTNGGGNREFTLVASDTTVGPFCFQTCDGTCPAGSGMVTFQVDMQNEPFKDTVSMAGNLQVAAGFPNDWTPGQILMDDADNDSIFDVTLTLPAGNYAYKFTTTIDGSDTWEPRPGGDRQLTVTDGLDTTLGVVCFASDAPTCPLDLDTISVTFRVDMSNEFVSDSGVFIAGGFQSPAWQKNQIKLDDSDGDLIYETTVKIKPSFYEYKYFNGANGDPTSDAFAEDGDFEAGGCGLGGFGNNRALELIDHPTDTVISVYVYNTCDIVNATSIEDDLNGLSSQFNIYPNPFTHQTTVSFSNPTGIRYSFRVLSLTGKVVEKIENITTESLVLDRKELSAGVYFLQVINPTGEQITKKMVIQ